MKITIFKAIKIGNLIELFRYSRPQPYNWTEKNRGKSQDTQVRSPELQERYVQMSTSRAKTKLQRLIQGNLKLYPKYKPVFLTLTFRENITDLKQANLKFSQFIKRLNRNAKHQIRYVAVPEFQKRGAVHYHLLVLNLPYIKNKFLAEKIWKNGFTFLEEAKNFQFTYHYITKYLNKSFGDPRCKGTKRYFYSLENHIEEFMNESYIRYSIIPELNDSDLIDEPRVYKMKDQEGNETGTTVMFKRYYIGGWRDEITAPIDSMQTENHNKYKNKSNIIKNEQRESLPDVEKERLLTL
jgi:uncharacterized protein YueI